jgi:hypothetical protein
MGIEEQKNPQLKYNIETKVAILEERINNNELILNKLNDAVDLISKSAQSIGKILAVHEEKLDSFERDERVISKIFEEYKSDSKIRETQYLKRIEKIETQLDEFAKFRWMVGGIAAVLALLATVVSGNYIHIDHIEGRQLNSEMRTNKNIFSSPIVDNR